MLDLGAGAGFDAFLAARAVGSSGRVIGVDMTPEMVTKARANAKNGGYAQVDFRLGEIEALPVADGIVDVIIRPRANSQEVIESWETKRPFAEQVFAADVLARKPTPGASKSSAGCCG